MSRVLVPGLLVEECSEVRRRRDLPVPGKILVHEGQKVAAHDVIATAELPGELRILRIGETLGIEPEEVVKGMRAKVGDTVHVDEILVEHVGLFGLFRSQFRSPVEGVFEFFTEKTGHIGIRLQPRVIKLQAYISGSVESVESQTSVVIAQSSAFVQGIFGVGGERTGILHMLEVANDRVLDTPAILKDCTGKILVGGTSPSAEFLKEAAKQGAQALITGGIDDRALREYLGYDIGIALTGDEDISMTVIITEGFGILPLSPRIRALLEKYVGREASVNGATQVRAGALRPEIIVPLLDSEFQSSQTKEGQGLRLGAEVRLIRYPYFGMFGKVKALPEQAQRIATGARTRVLEVEFTDGKRAIVPRANVELVE